MSTKFTNILKRCKHRHTRFTHPKCFDADGNPIEERERKLPRILLFDIETSPLRAYVWQKSVWKTNVGSDQVISEWFMLTWSAKWLFGGEIMSDRLTGKEAVDEDDSRIVASLWSLLDEADIVVAHNGDSFDVPNMNTRFIVHNMPPPAPYQTIDTKVIAKRQFGFTHNSLNALARLFGYPEKLETDFELWKRCVSGDDAALTYMEKYNNGDVDTLEDIYLRLRPWIKGHPNLGLYVESELPVCPNCGSEDVKMLDGKFSYTGTAKYPLFRCSCGAFGRVRKTVVPKDVKDNLLAGLSR